ncbi:MAG: ABC transporter permease subunit, partial [Oscillospiraceae bacterium]
MLAIFKREIYTYFTTPIGYVFLAIFYLLSGYFFLALCLLYDTSDLTYVFAQLFTVIIFLVPILTMRLFSEDLRNKTDQLLLTSPISLFSLVMGKYLSALTVYTIGISCVFVYSGVIASFTPPAWPMIIGNFLGLFLLGAALIAIGMFISSLTENQVIAAVAGFGIGLMLILFDAIISIIPSNFIKKIFIIC